MSYLAAAIITTELKTDTWRQTGVSSGHITYTSVGSSDTSVTAPTTTSFRLPTGSSYYIEASLGASNTSKNSTVLGRVYNITDAAYIGQAASLCINTSHGFEAKQGRRVVRALVLDSDITGSYIDIRIEVAVTGGSTTFTTTTSGINNISGTGVPTIKIIELPS